MSQTYLVCLGEMFVIELLGKSVKCVPFDMCLCTHVVLDDSSRFAGMTSRHLFLMVRLSRNGSDYTGSAL